MDRCLWRSSEPCCGHRQVAVEPQVFDLPVNPQRDRVVGKDDLLTSLWHARTVSKFAPSNPINSARRAIGDASNQQRRIPEVSAPTQGSGAGDWPRATAARAAARPILRRWYSSAVSE